MEHYFPKDQIEYELWNDAKDWMGNPRLFVKPIVRHDFDDSGEFDGNAYNKGGWVLYMLRYQIGEQAFFAGLKHYLEVNRGKNVVTADLTRAIEEATHINVDQFFSQWVYGAGAPRFDLAYTYDDAKHKLLLKVRQTQKLEGRVGLFTIPLKVEITTASEKKEYPITVSKAEEEFWFPADSAPTMVLFDKGGHYLKSADFHKEKKEWLYQLKNASETADRLDAVDALGKLKDDGDAIAALGDALKNDKAWGVRATAADNLGSTKNPGAEKLLLAALDTTKEPWVRNRIVSALGNFKDDKDVLAKVSAVAKEDNSYRAQASALLALGKLKAPGALDTLDAAVKADSPDSYVRNAALRAMGELGDDKAVPALREWAAPGKRIDSRQAAIASLARLDKSNKEITQTIASYLPEPHAPIRFTTIFALGARGDASAIPALENLLKREDLSIEMEPTIKEQIARLKKEPGSGQSGAQGQAGEKTEGDSAAVAKRLDRLEKLIQEMTERLKAIEEKLPPKK